MFVNVILRTALLTPVMIAVSFFMTIQASVDYSDHPGNGSGDHPGHCDRSKGVETGL